MVRARASKDALTYLDRVDPEGARKVRRRFPRHSLATIENASTNALVSINHDRYLAGAWLPVFGMEQALEHLAGASLETIGSPLLRPLLQGSMRLLGASPRSIVHVVPRTWSLVYHDFCAPKVRDTDLYTARVDFEDVHPLVFDHPAYFLVWRGLFHGIFKMAGHRGDAAMTVDRDRHLVVAELQWTKLETDQSA